VCWLYYTYRFCRHSSSLSPLSLRSPYPYLPITSSNSSLSIPIFALQSPIIIFTSFFSPVVRRMILFPLLCPPPLVHIICIIVKFKGVPLNISPQLCVSLTNQCISRSLAKPEAYSLCVFVQLFSQDDLPSVLFLPSLLLPIQVDHICSFPSRFLVTAIFRDASVFPCANCYLLFCHPDPPSSFVLSGSQFVDTTQVSRKDLIINVRQFRHL